jgi:hypothetical protein
LLVVELDSFQEIKDQMYAIARFGFKEPPRPTHYILYAISLEKYLRLELPHSRMSSSPVEFNGPVVFRLLNRHSRSQTEDTRALWEIGLLCTTCRALSR